jgi:hypothetical protein
MVKQWKLNRVVYKRYGGAVIWQQFNPMEPVGAYRQFLEDAEASRAFEIFDAKDREAFFYYYRRSHPFVIPAERFDFDKPWWRQASREDGK